MLVDIILACAPIALVAPIVVALLFSHANFETKTRLADTASRVAGGGREAAGGCPRGVQIARDIDRQSLHLAYRVAHADYRDHAALAHNWLFRHVVGPFFIWRRAARICEHNALATRTVGQAVQQT
ncbi:MAG TPA: hypothetical protein VJ777_12635 [Mycobacterium sp.]|nr:hypothetical protein [Mycobacterium sp.]